MANKLYEENYVKDIADAIREKNGTENTYKVSEMGAAIRAIENVVGNCNPLNIHYGDTAPEDTSKLWVKTSEPSKVQIINAIAEKGALVEDVSSSDITIEINDGITTVGNKIYITCGYSPDVDGGFLSDVRCFDPSTGETTIVGDLGDSLNGAMACSIGDKIYVCGGWSGSRGVCSDRIYCFDTTDNSVRTLNATITARENGSAVAVGNKVYIVGGYNGRTYKYPIEVLDTETEIVTTLSGTITYGMGARSINIGDNVYIVNGCDGYSYDSKIYQLNTADDSLTTLSYTFPKYCQKMGLGFNNNILYSFGGYSGGKHRYIQWVNIETGESGQFADMFTVEFDSMGVAKIDETFYIIGGRTGTKDVTTSKIHSYSGFVTLEPNALIIKTSDYNSSNVEITSSPDGNYFTSNVQSVYVTDGAGNKTSVEALLYKCGKWVRI